MSFNNVIVSCIQNSLDQLDLDAYFNGSDDSKKLMVLIKIKIKIKVRIIKIIKIIVMVMINLIIKRK